MAPNTFRALVVDQKDGNHHASFQTLEQNELPAGDVLIEVTYSSLNYKDGLAVTGKAKIFRSFPAVPGIDLVGTVLESASPEYHAGDHVIVTGYGIGETTWGGYSERARLKSEWLVPLPSNLSPQQAMAIGTAGFTAILAVMALEDHGVVPGEREIAVTGAAGGVGSIATAILAQLGYRVAAATGRSETHDYLRELGATTIIDRNELAQASKRPLESERWAGAIDSVGGTTLAGLLRQTARGGSIACCGNASGNTLETTVLPLILRGVSLVGIDSVAAPTVRRRVAWQRLSGGDLALAKLDAMTTIIPLSDIKQASEAILRGQVRGRTVVDVQQ